MSIEAVKALAESWLAEAKSLDENAGVTQQWSGVPLTEEVIAHRKTVARQFTEQANAVLVALSEPALHVHTNDEKPIDERLHEALVNVGMSHTPAYLHGYKATSKNERFMLKQAAIEFVAPYLARIAESEKATLFDLLYRLGDHCHVDNPDGYLHLDADGVRKRLFEHISYLEKHATGALRERLRRLDGRL